MRLRDLFDNYQPGPSRNARAETLPGQNDNGLPTDGSSALAPVVTKIPILLIKPGTVQTVQLGAYSFQLQTPAEIKLIA